MTERPPSESETRMTLVNQVQAMYARVTGEHMAHEDVNRLVTDGWTAGHLQTLHHLARHVHARPSALSFALSGDTEQALQHSTRYLYGYAYTLARTLGVDTAMTWMPVLAAAPADLDDALLNHLIMVGITAPIQDWHTQHGQRAPLAWAAGLGLTDRLTDHADQTLHVMAGLRGFQFPDPADLAIPVEATVEHTRAALRASLTGLP